jgi:hypothetical protein
VPLETPRRRQKDNIKIDRPIRGVECEVVNWIQLFQSRIQLADFFPFFFFFLFKEVMKYGFYKSLKYLELLNNWQLLMKDTVYWKELSSSLEFIFHKPITYRGARRFIKKKFLY